MNVQLVKCFSTLMYINECSNRKVF